MTDTVELFGIVVSRTEAHAMGAIDPSTGEIYTVEARITDPTDQQ